MQPECQELVQVVEPPPIPPPPDLPDLQLAGYWLWGMLFLAVVIFELWAILKRRRTLSQTVQHGPRWFRWAIGLGFVALLGHLFL